MTTLRLRTRTVLSTSLLVVSVALGPDSISAIAAQASQPLPRPSLEGIAPTPRARAEAVRRHYDELTESERPAAARAEAAGALGQIYLALNLFEAAQAALETASDLAESDLRWVYYLGIVHQTLGRPDTALRALSAAHELAPRDLATLVRIGNLHLLLGDETAADQAFGSVLEIDPQSAAAHYGLGRSASQSGDYERATRELEQTLVLQPDASVVHYPLGQAYRRLGDLDKARLHLGQRGEDEVVFPDPLTDQVGRLILGSAFETLQSMAADHENFTESDYLGFALSQLGRAGGVTDELREALRLQALEGARLDPSSAAAVEDRLVRGRIQYALGGLLIDQSLEQEAAIELRTAVDLAPTLEDARIKLGNIAMRAGNIEEGIAEYTAALIVNPDSTAALLKRAAANMVRERWEQAIPDLEHARRIDTQETEALLRLALSHRRLGQADEAVRLYEVALDGDLGLEELAGTHLELGHVAAERDQTDSALEHYRAAFVADAGLGEARFAHATLLGRLARYDDSAVAYRALIELDPGHEQARLGEATALALAGHEADARRRLDEGVAALPSSLGLTQALARLLASARDRTLRDGPRAIDLATQAVTAVSSLENAETLAMAMAEAGRFADAVALQSQLVEDARTRGEQSVLLRLDRHLALYSDGQACCG